MARDRQTTRRRFLTAAGGAAATAALAGCTGGDGGDGGTETTTSDDMGGDETTTTTDDGGNEETTTLTYARGNDSGTLDPQNTTSGEDVKVSNQCYDTLIQFEPGETALTQGLATNWDLSGTTTTLTLREGVQFHNGEEFTAQDFIATYRRFTDPDYEHYPGDEYASVYGGFTLGWIDSIEADGDYNLTIELSQQYAPFLRNLAMFAASVLSETAIQELGTDLSEQPVGTGPFEFDEWDTSNQQIRLSANDDYWGEGPHVDEVVFTAVGSNNSRAQTLASGGADIIDGLGAQSSQIVEGADNAELKAIDGINVGYMAFNMATFEPFRSREVRQAISYAIDTEAIVNTIYQGIASQASQPIPSNVMGYNDSIDPYPHDPDEAQSLLEDAGYGDGFEFELATFKNPRTYNPSPIQAAETVKSNLADVGIDVTINQQPFNPFLEYTSAGKHDACFLGWMTDNADPDNFFYSLLHPQLPEEDLPGEDQDWVDAWGNSDFNTLDVAAWANTEYMTLVEEAQTTYDQSTRVEKYQQAAQIAHDEAPWVFIDHAQELRGVSNSVSGFTVAPISGPFLNRVTLE